ncbi:homeobox protein 5-like [Galleria mellonella]|uniref:Homeobox protein 5-like n=1 Tax=Galleria mellonella TaxID=7137 RepID=A0ABM3MRJ7_GALME|nr:homeobox protein 5-like [Galleria mellonella]
MTTVTLNFMSALLYDSNDGRLTKRQSMLQYARNMIRLSGCLSFMCHLFVSCMMHQETWRALCRCLAEVCQNSHENKNYCSHLISTGVRRCCDGDMEAALVLQSLLHNHERNVQLFIGCSGLTMFNRQLLQSSASLHLLYTVSQNSDAIILIKDNDNVINILRDFLKLYGTDSWVGQWSILILHNVNRHRNGLDKNIEKDDNLDDLKLQTQQQQNDKDLNVIDEANDKCNKMESNYIDTTRLFYNIHKELHWKPNNNRDIGFENLNRRGYSPVITMKGHNKVKSTGKYTMSQNVSSSNSYVNDISFSFLLKHNFRESTIEYVNKEKIHNNRNPNSNKENTITTFADHILTNNANSYKEYANEVHKISESYFNKYNINVQNDEENIMNFKPTIVSTPKKNNLNVNTNTSQCLDTELKRIKHNHIVKRRHRRQIKPKKLEKDIKHKTVGGMKSFFSAINDSCTTFVKTVKNIFKPKKNTDVIKDTVEEFSSNNITTTKEPCTYSFTNYMRQRDTILGNKWPNNGNITHSVNTDITSKKSCETCNNTVVLKQKLVNDDNLRQTVKKLKLGINLYGCDFKKISAALWPREKYMTPDVLYNLYRKLILK